MSWISHVDGSHIAELRFVDDQPCLGALFDKDTVHTINGESRRPLFGAFITGKDSHCCVCCHEWILICLPPHLARNLHASRSECG